MQNNFITNLLDLKGVKVTKFRNRKNRIRIHIELPVKEHICPCCHSKTSKIHDYRFQLIKDIPNVERVELLPYHSMAKEKYKKLGIEYRLGDTINMDKEKCKKLQNLLKND